MANKLTWRKWVGITTENKEVIQDYLDFRLNVAKKSKTTVENESNTIRKLARFLGDKPLREAVQKDMEKFFGDPSIVKGSNSRDLYAVHINTFYNRILKLGKKKKPKIMNWFEYQTSDEKEKNKDPNAFDKYFIHPEEYEALIKYSPDPQEKALWQTMYLSGARPSEICSMKINSIREFDNGYEITVYESKTKARNIPLSETPEHLLYWARNHLLVDKPEGPMWLSQSKRIMNNPMITDVIGFKLKKAIQRSGIKNTITPHCFRKTRASIMFNTPVGNDDKLMGKFFGWKPKTVVERREQYDLRTHNTLREKIFGDATKKEPSYDALKIEKERADKYVDEIKELKQKIKELKPSEEEIEKQVESRMKELEKRIMVNLKEMITKPGKITFDYKDLETL